MNFETRADANFLRNVLEVLSPDEVKSREFTNHLNFFFCKKCPWGGPPLGRTLIGVCFSACLVSWSKTKWFRTKSSFSDESLWSYIDTSHCAKEYLTLCSWKPHILLIISYIVLKNTSHCAHGYLTLCSWISHIELIAISHCAQE